LRQKKTSGKIAHRQTTVLSARQRINPVFKQQLGCSTASPKREHTARSCNAALTRDWLERDRQPAGDTKSPTDAAQQHAEIAAHDVTGIFVKRKSAADDDDARSHVSLIEIMGSSSSSQSINTGTDRPFVTSASSRLLKN
jgi:hypothetical protein